MYPVHFLTPTIVYQLHLLIPKSVYPLHLSDLGAQKWSGYTDLGDKKYNMYFLFYGNLGNFINVINNAILGEALKDTFLGKWQLTMLHNMKPVTVMRIVCIYKTL